jgi:myo-inositol-1(or 4)-monophosphatase
MAALLPITSAIPPFMSEYLRACEEAARIGGAVLDQWRHRVTAREKGPSDLVTEADHASQQAIQTFLAQEFPDFDFLGEESPLEEQRKKQSGEFRWIVDPLDGTVNYVHGLQGWGVSIALEQSGRMIAGVVYDPVSGECFRAAAGGGAWLNEQRIAPSSIRSLSSALVAASFPPRVQRHSRELRQFTEVLLRAQSTRRLGSAALNLCYVACGRLDAYWATSIKIWDCAAGALIVEEAGATLRNLEGGSPDLTDPKLIAASTPSLAAELSSVLLAQ